MARATHAVALASVADEAGLLERVELLEDAGPAGPEGRREPVRRGRAGLAQEQQQRSSEG
jgi:hypothetical protein